VRLAQDACREERGGWTLGIGTEHHVPEPRIVDDGAIRVLDLAQQLTGPGVEGIDDAVSKVANQQLATEDAKACVWSQGDAPGRVQNPPCGETAYEVTLKVELIDETPARPDDWIVLGRVLSGVGYKDRTGDHVNSERGIAIRQIMVAEVSVQLNGLVVLVVDFDLRAAEVRRQEKVSDFVMEQGQPLVDRMTS
jgi:hypothetical protein